MNFSELDLKNYLKKELTGKDFGYDWEWTVRKAFDSFIKEQGLKVEDFTISRYGVSRRSAHGQTAYIMYKNKQEIGYIEAKKLKGAHHYAWGGGYNDWTFKDFGVVFYAKDFITAIDEANKRIVANEDAKTKMKNNAIELLKIAKEKFGPDAHSVVDYLKDHYWSLDMENN